jgi:hypothetical protein
MKSLHHYLAAAALGIAGLLAHQPTMAAEPVGITAIDVRSGVVTAVNGARSRTVQFKVANTALLKSLMVGQVVNADLGTKKVSINYSEPCCSIVNTQSGPDGSQTGAVGSASSNAPGNSLGGGLPPVKVSSGKDFPNCSTCAAACKVCAEWGQECRCSLIATGSSPGTEDDTWSCHCTGAAPRSPRN